MNEDLIKDLESILAKLPDIRDGRVYDQVVDILEDIIADLKDEDMLRESLKAASEKPLIYKGSFAQYVEEETPGQLRDRIDKALERLYPENPELRGKWMLSPNQELGGKSPFGIIIVEQRAGLERILQYLESQT